MSVSGCTAKNHPHLLKKFPKIFSFNSDLARSEKLCAKQAKMTKKTPDRDVTSCHLVDVSLVCEDGHSASAHRVILASHSARKRELEGGKTVSGTGMIWNALFY